MKDVFSVFLAVLIGLIIVAYMIRLRGKNNKLTVASFRPDASSGGGAKVANIAAIAALVLMLFGFFMLKSVYAMWVGMSVLLIALVVGQFLSRNR